MSRLLIEVARRNLATWGIGSHDPNPGGRVYTDDTYRDLRLGGFVSLEGALAKFVLAEAAGTSFRKPTGMRQMIVGIGTIQDGEYIVRRFYLDERFALEEGQTETLGYFLQVVSDGRNVVIDAETKLYSQALDYEPADANDWFQWLGGGDVDRPIIGTSTLQYGGHEYLRHWGVSAPGQGTVVVQPRQFSELLESRASSTQSVGHGAMLYGRVFGAPAMQEWVFTSALRQRRSPSMQEERWIEAWIGLSLTRAEFTAT